MLFPCSKSEVIKPGPDFFARLEDDDAKRRASRGRGESIPSVSGSAIVKHGSRSPRIEQPLKMPDPLYLSPEDQKLLQIYRNIPICAWVSYGAGGRSSCPIYAHAQNNNFSDLALRHSIMAFGACHKAKHEGRGREESFQQIATCLRYMRSQLSGLTLDDGFVAAVSIIVVLELHAFDWQTIHIHVTGAVKAIEHIQATKPAGEGLSLVVRYSIMFLSYIDAYAAFLGYGMAMPDDFISIELPWVQQIAPDLNSARWLLSDFKHVEFLHIVAKYKIWAHRQRQMGLEESIIVSWGAKIMRRLEEWRQYNILPYSEFAQTSAADNERCFLQYHRLEFISRAHAEMHLLWSTLLLMTSFVAFPTPGPNGPGRLTAAIEFCQIFAYLADYVSSAGVESRAFGQFFSRLTFEDSRFTAEYRWAEMQYTPPLSRVILEMHGIITNMRQHLEKEFNVNW